VFGMTFKENCRDIRNSKVIDIVRELQGYGCQVHIHDPIADSEQCLHEYGLSLTPWDELPEASAIIAAVAHKEYAEGRIEKLLEKVIAGGIFADVKSAFDADAICAAGVRLWRL
jgi:UDP-N-acetyl-D-galactosamine dehydrogenase